MKSDVLMRLRVSSGSPDGVMCVGHNRFEGREKIREFYTWRERQALTAISSVKTTRHLINNFIVESSDEGGAKVLGIISFYGAAVRPPAPSVIAASSSSTPEAKQRSAPPEAPSSETARRPYAAHVPPRSSAAPVSQWQRTRS